MNLPEVSLEIIRGRATQQVRPVTSSAFLIGSAADCDLMLAAPQFPEIHAYLILRPDGVALRYLGGKPALTVNGRLVRSQRLEDGDIIATGPYEFRVSIHERTTPGGPRRPHYQPLSTDLAHAASSDTEDAAREVRELLLDVRASLLGTRSTHVYQEPSRHNVAV